MMDVFLAVYEKDPTPANWQRLEAGLELLARYAKIFRIGQPLKLYYEGHLLRLENKTEEATKKFTEALALAQTLGIEYDLPRLQKPLTLA